MHVRVDYQVSNYITGGINQITETEQNAEAGRLRAKHLGGLCTLLSFLDIKPVQDGVSNSELYALQDSLRAVGELGSYLADSLYGNVSELEDIIGRLSTFTEVSEEAQ